MRFKELPAEYALVLQQISEDGGDGIDDLVDMVRVDRNRLQHIVASLHHKCLITVEDLGYSLWLDLSNKGRRLMQYLWPEAALQH